MTEIRKVGIIGCGLMGTGIAEACVVAGVPTILVKATGGDPASALGRIKKSIDRATAKGKLDAERAAHALSLLSAGADLDALSDCDLVIESAAENLGAKQELFRRLEQVVRPTAVIGSNTSSLRLAALAEALEHKQRFIGLHFFSPAQIMKLVELGPTAQTRPEVTAALEKFCETIGKVPVVIGDHPGYVVNRLLVPYMLHAIETLEHGVAGPEAIDTAMKLGCGHPLGPLALADLIGLDVVFAMARSLYQEHSDPRFRCPPLLRRLVMAGSLGKKTGAGFYLYGDAVKPNPAVFEFNQPSSPSASSSDIHAA